MIQAKIEEIQSRPYTETYQPTYPNMETLLEAIHELRETTPVTNPEQIRELRARLGDVVEGRLDEPIIITGPCAEPVEGLDTPMHEIVDRTLTGLGVVKRSLKRAIHIRRDRGQNTKPRSNEHEIVDGVEVVSYMGDAVNGKDLAHRTPDPSRMVGAALQARDIEHDLKERVGEHVSAAHEALLLPYEHAFMQEENDGVYLTSTDLPWVGMRTNNVDSEHVQLLKEVENPVGVKIGASSDAEHMRELAETLNPRGEAGKLVLMLRAGLDNADATREIVAAIKQHASNAVIMYDIHGATITNEHGEKVRSVSRIIEEINQLAGICHDHGLKLHGLHLETTHDNTRMECVDTPNGRPTHPGNVDPQLNPAQLEKVLKAVEGKLL